MAITFVQAVNTPLVETNGVFSTQATLPARVTRGNALVVATITSINAGNGGLDPFLSLTSLLGNVFTPLGPALGQDGGAGNQINNNWLRLWFAPSSPAGIETLTLAVSVLNGVQNPAMWLGVAEYAGVAAAIAVDGFASKKNPFTGNLGSLAPSCGPILTTAPGDLIVAAMTAGNGGPYTAGSGFTARWTDISGSAGFLFEDQVQSAAGSISPAFTGAGNYWAIAAAALLPQIAARGLSATVTAGPLVIGSDTRVLVSAVKSLASGLAVTDATVRLQLTDRAGTLVTLPEQAWPIQGANLGAGSYEAWLPPDLGISPNVVYTLTVTLTSPEGTLVKTEQLVAGTSA